MHGWRNRFTHLSILLMLWSMGLCCSACINRDTSPLPTHPVGSNFSLIAGGEDGTGIISSGGKKIIGYLGDLPMETLDDILFADSIDYLWLVELTRSDHGFKESVVSVAEDIFESKSVEEAQKIRVQADGTFTITTDSTQRNLIVKVFLKDSTTQEAVFSNELPAAATYFIEPIYKRSSYVAQIFRNMVYEGQDPESVDTIFLKDRLNMKKLVAKTNANGISLSQFVHSIGRLVAESKGLMERSMADSSFSSLEAAQVPDLLASIYDAHLDLYQWYAHAQNKYLYHPDQIAVVDQEYTSNSIALQVQMGVDLVTLSRCYSLMYDTLRFSLLPVLVKGSVWNENTYLNYLYGQFTLQKLHWMTQLLLLWLDKEIIPDSHLLDASTEMYQRIILPIQIEQQALLNQWETQLDVSTLTRAAVDAGIEDYAINIISHLSTTLPSIDHATLNALSDNPEDADSLKRIASKVEIFTFYDDLEIHRNTLFQTLKEMESYNPSLDGSMEKLITSLQQMAFEAYRTYNTSVEPYLQTFAGLNEAMKTENPALYRIKQHLASLLSFWLDV